MRLLPRIAVALAMTLAASQSFAATFPDRTIRVIVAFGPGGVSDLVARIVADGMSARLHQPVIVENHAGAQGLIGMRDLVGAKPDGYTILAGGFGGQILAPLLKPDFPFDIKTAVTPIAQISEFSNVLVVNNQLPVNTLQELIAYAKARPGQLNFASEGVGTSSHLAAEFFMEKTGVKMVHVPYKGSPPALNDIRGGVVQLTFANLPASVGLIKSGMIKPIVVTGAQRSEVLPNVPTAVESGLPGFTVSSWNGVYGPAGLPKDIRDKLSDTIMATLKDPAVQERMRKINIEPVGKGADEFTPFTYAELARWKEVIDKAGIKIAK
ncbi:MAG: tripartite tricarboxylate transporter substrate binding protein [Proteobacteria bacterium]|nr:tripartite tricarboxylate transporter substrate binding protein [Pseudomonadota bacterium]